MTENTITKALREAMESEYAPFLDAPKHTFSPEFERKMDKLLKRQRTWSWRLTNTWGKCAALAALCLVLMLTGLFTVSADAREEFTKEYQRIMQEVRAISLKQDQAAAANDRIMKSFACDENGMWVYPDDFAGTYINEEILVLCLKDPSAESINRYMSIAGDKAEYVRIRTVAFSQNELQTVAESQADAFNRQGLLVYSYWVDPVQNGIGFLTAEENVESLAILFKEAYPDIPCDVKASDPPVVTAK